MICPTAPKNPIVVFFLQLDSRIEPLRPCWSCLTNDSPCLLQRELLGTEPGTDPTYPWTQHPAYESRARLAHQISVSPGKRLSSELREPIKTTQEPEEETSQPSFVHNTPEVGGSSKSQANSAQKTSSRLTSLTAKANNEVSHIPHCEHLGWGLDNHVTKSQEIQMIRVFL